MKDPSKWQAIKAILFASNWIVYTDRASIGSISPLYADKFIDKTNTENERLRLISIEHERNMHELGDRDA